MKTPRPPLRLVERAARDDAQGLADEPDLADTPLLGGAGDDGRAGDDADFEHVEGTWHARDPESGETSDDAAAPPRKFSPRFVVLGLIVFQLLVATSYGAKYLELVRSGGVSPAAALLGVPSSLCLYVGASWLALRPGHGRALFLVAAVGLGLSVPVWGVSYGWTWPMAFGAMLGLAGAWYARPESPPEDGEPGEEADGSDHETGRVLILRDRDLH